MDLFDVGRHLHSAIGMVALASFWVAALAAKGSRRHRTAGKVYLVALLGVMTMSTLMVAGRAIQGDVGRAVFLAFLISMVATASWLTWLSTRGERSPERLTGRTYRVLATSLVAGGAAMFGLGAVRGVPLMMFLPLLGLGFGANMWRLALSSRRDAGWWLEHHMNGAMLNFIATHDSFMALGIGSVVPELRQPVPRMLIAVGVTVVAILLRVGLGRKQRRMPSTTAGVPISRRAVMRPL